MNTVSPRLWFGAAVLTFACASIANAFGPVDRSRAERVLDHVCAGVRDHYFDPSAIPPDFGVQIESARQQIRHADSNNAAYGIVANLLAKVDVDDLRLLPPPRETQVVHDWGWQIAGDKAYVSVVNPGSDPERAGVRLGDLVMQVESLPINRATSQRVVYAYQLIAPRPTLRVILQSPGSEPRQVEVAGREVPFGEGPFIWNTSFHTASADGKTTTPDRKHPANRRKIGDVLVWRPIEIDFFDEEFRRIRKELGEARGLVLDLRGLFIGSLKATATVCEMLTRGDYALAKLQRRKATEVISVRPGKSAFAGQIVVLTSFGTSGAAEPLAHALRTHGGALLMGDRTSGDFRERSAYSMIDARFRSNIDLANLWLPTARILVDQDIDLHGKGVIPDWQIVPSVDDFAQNRDPVLSRALRTLKVELSPAAAGTFYSSKS